MQVGGAVWVGPDDEPTQALRVGLAGQGAVGVEHGQGVGAGVRGPVRGLGVGQLDQQRLRERKAPEERKAKAKPETDP